jgi:hypothetical protein
VEVGQSSARRNNIENYSAGSRQSFIEIDYLSNKWYTSINAKQTKKKTMIQQSDKTTTKMIIYLPLKAVQQG